MGALLRFQDVTTLFHEVGHALHAVLGVKSALPSMAGNDGVKTDFVEMPSQMLEVCVCKIVSTCTCKIVVYVGTCTCKIQTIELYG